jgi:hypothetical protein
LNSAESLCINVVFLVGNATGDSLPDLFIASIFWYVAEFRLWSTVFSMNILIAKTFFLWGFDSIFACPGLLYDYFHRDWNPLAMIIFRMIWALNYPLFCSFE